ncbi:uncharacterized protein ATC70_003658 [Mucor velutinosus]|uniref:Uncharacterized protein n=1 Tax=Mucor velutinosus TaxID=708070 RepID=A0AAN7HZ20_9FUNG|nr:hypothetical protein ATC70_003658 [Mucor velutinosus]
MTINLTLNLSEDEERICGIVDEYLKQHAISEWKYEAALKILIDLNLIVEPTDNNMKKLGEIYLKECLSNYQDRIANCSVEEKEKIESLQHAIHHICISTPIKKLLHVGKYSQQILDEAVINKASKSQQNEEDQQRQGVSQAPSTHFHTTMSPNERMAFFCDKFGTDGYLDLMTDKIANRYKKKLKETANSLELKLQPMIAKNERDMLIKIAECKNGVDIENLLTSFYAQRDMDPMCRYIRLAFSTMAELWSSRLLLKTNNNESWFRAHVYSAVFDNAFIYDDKFTSKRADCYSNITKEFKDIDNQRVDFILRNINDDNDYLSAEEKPGLKGVKSDMKKGKTLQKTILRKWTGHLGSVEIMKQLEAITCQWQALKFTIYGTRHVSENHLVTYTKGTFSVPKDENHAASFANVLAAVLSLRRLVYLNYAKLNTILEAKYAHQLDTMHFSSDSELNFCSDSTEGLQQQEILATDGDEFNSVIDAELESQILQSLSKITVEEDVISFKDWEELILLRTSRKRKASS